MNQKHRATKWALLLFWMVLISGTHASSHAHGQAADDVQVPRRPNIVFILADDLGWTDVACYGSGFYKTPNIDQLASQGMKFTNGYTCGPNCAPTPAALMSGTYEPRTGIYTVGRIARLH